MPLELNVEELGGVWTELVVTTSYSGSFIAGGALFVGNVVAPVAREVGI